MPLLGSGTHEAYITASGMDDLLDERLDFAYDDRAGFLTCPPTWALG